MYEEIVYFGKSDKMIKISGKVDKPELTTYLIFPSIKKWNIESIVSARLSTFPFIFIIYIYIYIYIYILKKTII